MHTSLTEIENRLWSAADELRLKQKTLRSAETHQLEERIAENVAKILTNF